MITLNAEMRDVKVNPKVIRKEGNVPAIFYGQGQVSTPIAVNKIDFTKVFSQAGESSIITLKTPKGSLDALIHDVQRDPVFGDPVHIDFYVVAKDHKIQVSVPLEFIGNAPAEKQGGIVLKVLHELLIESLPAKLPQHLTIDLAKLSQIGSHISVADLDLPEGVRAMIAGTEIIVSISLPSEEKEEVATMDLSAIEVEKKGKKEEDETTEA